MLITERIFGRPAALNTGANGVVVNTSYFCPLGYSSALSIEADIPTILIWSFVVCLLLWSCPAAVIFAVSGVIIYAIYGMFLGWSFSHILIESTERPPLVADSDSPSAIVLPCCIVGVGASLDDPSPYFIFAGFLHSMSLAGYKSHLSCITSTRLGCSGSKVAYRGASFIPAIALTGPEIVVAMPFPVRPDCDKTPKPLPGEISDPAGKQSFFPEASAGLGVTRNNFMRCCQNLFAAITSALPIGSAIFRGALVWGKSTETLVIQIFGWARHDISPLRFA